MFVELCFHELIILTQFINSVHDFLKCSDNHDVEKEEEEKDLPLEMQYEEPNLDDPDLDPLEYSVRRFVPMPKKYYWESTGDNNNSDNNENDDEGNTNNNENENSTDNDNNNNNATRSLENPTSPKPEKNSNNTKKDISLKIKTWHNTIYFLGKLVKGAERVGEVVANASGLNSSRYQYVTDSMTEEDWKIAKEIHEEKRKKREQRRKEVEEKRENQEAMKDAGVVPDAI